MEETKLKENIAKNIAAYRKLCGLTQLELAERLNYSDKAVSKWERAEAVPDVYVLTELAELFKIHVDDLLKEKAIDKIYIGISVEKKVIVPIMAVIAVFLVATIVFAFLIMFSAPISKPWLCFVFAVPAASISGLIFASVWKKLFLILLYASMITWTLATSIFLSINLPNKFVCFIICIPVEGLLVLWYIMAKIAKHRKMKIVKRP